MNSTQFIERRRRAGSVLYNDGDYAEIATCGTEGDEKDLYLADIQLHREDTDDTPEEFQQRFPVGMWLDILRTIQVSPKVDSETFTRLTSEDRLVTISLPWSAGSVVRTGRH